MDELETTNLPEGVEPEAEVETEVQFEPQIDDDGNPIEDNAEPEDDEEEVDLGDLKLKLSKAEAEKVRLALLRQEDYTRKTQELAEQRKTFEADRQALSQADAEELNARGNLSNLSARITQYQQVDWQGWKQRARAVDADNFSTTEMDRYTDAKEEFENLERAQQQTLAFLQHKAQQRTSKQQQAETAYRESVAKLRDEGTPELKKAIPDWSRAKADALTDGMVKHFGFTRDDLADIDDPKLYLVMHAAITGLESQAKARKAQTLQKQTEVQPAAKASRASAPPAGLDDRLSAEEWVKRRNAQERKRA